MVGGFLGELRLGRVGYPVGSFSFASWVEDSYESPPDVNSESKVSSSFCLGYTVVTLCISSQAHDAKAQRQSLDMSPGLVLVHQSWI
ncbi:hypothetical protein V6N13_147680 [Hibiscus sabdariffa]